MPSDYLNPLASPTKGAGGPTGTWRTQRPVYDPEKCNGCLLCWIFCPEAVIGKSDRSIDLAYCKGCGICAAECAKGAIKMVREEAQ